MLGIHGTAFDQDFIHLAEALPPSAIRLAIDSALTGQNDSAVFEVEPTDAASETAHFVEATVRPYRVDKRAIEGAVLELTDVTKLEQRASRRDPDAASDSTGRSPPTAGSCGRTKS